MNNTTATFPNVGVYGEARTMDIVAGICFSLTALLALVCNLFVLVVLHRSRRRFDDIMRYLIQTLAVSDLVGGFACCLFQVLRITLKTFPFSIMICKAIPFMSFYMVLRSLYLMCIINLYRCVSVVYPLAHRRYINMRRMRISVFTVCGCLCSFVVPLLLFRNELRSGILNTLCEFRSSRELGDHEPGNHEPGDHEPGNHEPGDHEPGDHEPGDHEPEYHEPEFYSRVANTRGLFAIVSLVIPLAIITITNIKLLIIACKVAQKNKHVRDQAVSSSSSFGQDNQQGNTPSAHHNALYVRSSDNDPRRNRGNFYAKVRAILGFKGLRTLLAITLMFYVSCVPACVLIGISVEHHDTISSPLFMASSLLLLGNSWWNALIFLFLSKTFREHAVKLKEMFVLHCTLKCDAV
ncbi:uncharacterized protein LOC121406232 [Lytechinus variegatus]|uniref:uncharacterized protein LOC121406232 n=1 Tax=Lytechinus variegatus TaxID=7654 RepID=UPI001BB1987A|nr:uncharacterized protein LOC121406232 [Lytechinus variegatus]